MKRPSEILTLLLIVLLLAGLTISCSTVPTTNSDTSDATSSETSTEDDQSEFNLDVIPQMLNGFSIPGQRCVFLVTIEDSEHNNANKITISAEADNAEIILANDEISQNQVAEITVIPEANSEGKTVDVKFIGTRGQKTDTETISFEVIEGEDDRQDTAEALRAKFTNWLADNHPELGITNDTEWTGTMVSPQWLVVSHYLFFSDEWEMHVEWHIMIAPDDWARIDLRKRFEEDSPSYAFEITSREADDEPIAIDVPDTVWR